MSHSTGTCTSTNNPLVVLFVHDKKARQFTASRQCGAEVSHNQTRAIDIDRDERSIFSPQILQPQMFPRQETMEDGSTEDKQQRRSTRPKPR